MSQRGSQSERDFLTRIAVGSSIVITWFLVTLAAELLGNQANETDLGQNVGRSLLVAGVVVVPLTALVWAGIKLWRWRHPTLPESPLSAEAAWPAEPEPAAWRPPGPIYARDDEVTEAVRTLLDTGVAVVYGARDVGTSAVAEAAVQWLIDERRVDAQYVARVDLRSRSSRTPDDPRATAGRILSMFRLDEPANGTPRVLANAAERLHDVLAKQYSVLLLDNVTVPAEIDWLIPQWTERNNRQPWLVIAGETSIGSVVSDSRVLVNPLSTDGMRAIWHADTNTPPRPSVSDPVARLLDACHGRPRAIKAVARETTGTDREAEVGSLLATMTTDEENPLVGIWRAILLRTEVSLSRDARWLLHALAVIPVTALAREAIVALVTAHAPDTDPGSGRALPEPFEKLRIPGFVEEVDGRYRLPLEIRRAITGRTDQEDAQIARVAVPALVRHHADRVVRRANQFDVRSVGAAAAKWLGDEEPTLRPLFTPQNYEDGEVLAAVIDDLARIAGALEYWYVREQQADGLLTVSTGFGVLADRVQRSGLSALAAARKATAYRMVGQWQEADAQLCLVEGEARGTTDHALGTELVTRLWVERALLAVGRDASEQAKARSALEAIADQGRHPGAGIALLNLGALYLTEKSPEAALECLDRAEAMARERNDTGCRAQAVELRGIARAGEDLHEAVSLWQEARQLFEAIGDEQGQARCLQHLGAAAVANTTVAARLADAVTLLEQSKRLRAGQPDTALVDEYLRIAGSPSGDNG
jgi:tetratricopeptide (TPR) repeat protein